MNSEKSASVVEGLPKNIYCDLVQTLNTKCIQISLLGKKEYNYFKLGGFSTKSIQNDFKIEPF